MLLSKLGPLSSLVITSAATLGAALAMGPGCGDDTETNEPPPTPTLRAGDVCSTPQPGSVKLRFVPAEVHLLACSGGACPERTVDLEMLPDVCAPTPFTLDASTLKATPAKTAFDLYSPSASMTINAGSATAGDQTITARVPAGDGTEVTATLKVFVHDASAPGACTGTTNDPSLVAGKTVEGTGALVGATIGLQPGANDANHGSFLWSVAPFATSISCGNLEVPEGYVALGQAVTFGPNDKVLPREIPLTVPANPGLMPDKARLRHLEILYSGPGFTKARTIPASNLRFVRTASGTWAVSFLAPRLGTYQAIVRSDAGTKTFKRRLTHRAVLGVSMGGIGTSMFGMRHHDKFDVIAPLGGPGSWAWFLDHIQNNQMAGFRPIQPGTVLADIPIEKVECVDASTCQPDEVCIGQTPTRSGRCTLMAKPRLPYEHNDTYNNWWAEYPRTGTGGAFPRSEYAQIFRDLSLMFGNPNGDNLSEGGEFLPAGVPPDDPSVTGGHPNNECRTWVDPIDGTPDHERQVELANSCPVDRCNNTLTLDDYYDDEFNPDGTFPVITVCDGTSPDEDQSPWANAWKADGDNRYPLELALAVDYNGNGKRDELEPIIRAGHEPFRDFGADGVASVNEPGYVAGVNDDPAGDDFDPQFNPGGTEKNYRYDPGEPFDDVGLDGVAGTKQQPAYPVGYRNPGDGYDVGEGDGQFTISRGLQRFWDRDPNSLLARRSEGPGGALDDAALQRVDVWTDGGLRDIFNFHVSAQHLAGSLHWRGKATTYFSDFTEMPGSTPGDTSTFAPALLPWSDLPSSVMMRYGMIDPDARAIEKGNGQHVGTAEQVISRLQTALYFVGSRWNEPELRSLTKNSNDDPVEGAELCEIDGTCNFEFAASDGRKGPVTVNLPPGYSHKEMQDRRYPVIYMLHGYGQTPEDLGAAIIFIGNWMNGSTDNMRTRLPKAIIVYVDGRCRIGPTGVAECIRGGFYTDSPRVDGMQNETWWLELMQHIDTRFRTMGESEVDWPED